MSDPKIEFTYLVPEDEECGSPGVTIQIDSDSDVFLMQEEGYGMMLSLPQAFALSQALSQILIRHARSWGPVSRNLRVVN